MLKWKRSRECMTFTDKDIYFRKLNVFALRTHTHLSKRLTGKAIMLMNWLKA